MGQFNLSPSLLMRMSRRPSSSALPPAKAPICSIPKSRSSRPSPPALRIRDPPAAAGMAAGKARKRARRAALASGGDRIGALPDETLHHVLSFLPAQQAVRTCVLARRWRDLWKSATGLRIVGADGKAPVPFEEVREFVDSLLLLRGSSPVETFELRVAGADADVRHMRLWVRYAVQCKVQVLRVSIHGTTHARLQPEDPPLASRHLTKLELCGLEFNDDFLDFSRCPELQDLKIKNCSFEHAKRISSLSLRHLTTRRSTFNPSFRARILAPNLTSLVLSGTLGMTPVLQKMPLLVKATVAFCGLCEDSCSSPAPNYVSYMDCDKSCRGCTRDDTACVILQAVSQAKDLLLMAHPDMFIFRRDLKGCPTFNRLKYLSLNENWCVPDQYPLACILEHTPVLEELFFLLYSKIHLLEANVQIKGRFNPKELPPTISSHLKDVRISFGGVDGNVLKVLQFLSKFNIKMKILHHVLVMGSGKIPSDPFYSQVFVHLHASILQWCASVFGKDKATKKFVTLAK